MKIFIARGEEKSGPFTLDQVREHLEQGVLLPDDLAFHDGLDDWLPLSELMDSVETALDGSTENAGGKKKLFIGIGATVVVLAIAAVVWFILGLGKNHKRLVWEFATEFNVGSSPAIGADGTVYIGSSDKKVYALDGKTGAKKWEFETGNSVWSSPAIGADGTVYVGSDDKKIHALDGKTGARKWEFVARSYVRSSPAIGKDGTVYVGSKDGKVYALDGETGAKKWEFVTGGKVESAPAIGVDGTVYIGSFDGNVYAIKTDSKGLAKSPWPMRGQNAQHTGRAP
jgi:outer membrane protein assembly factor BamB